MGSIPVFPITTLVTSIIPFLFATLLTLMTYFKRVQSRKNTTKHEASSKNTLKPPLPPGPTPWPIAGCVPEMVHNKPVFRWIHRYMEEKNTNIACFLLGNTHVISVTCPKIAREILKKQDALFTSRPHSFASRTFSNGYLTIALTPFGEQWRKMRRVISSETLCPSKHNWLHNKRAEEADNLVKYVLNQCRTAQNSEVNLRIASRHYCGNVIRKLVFGIRYFCEEREDGGPNIKEEQHVDAIFDALKYVFAFCISDYFPSLVGLDLDGHEKIVKQTMMTINNLHEPIINERIQQWRNHAALFNDNVDEKQPQDLLDVLISLKDGKGRPLLTPQEIHGQITEIMMAAVDNPSNAVEWAMAEMLNQPQLLRKAVEEIDRVVGRERLVQESDIPNLNYIKACAREAFRLHPIAPFNVPHVATSNTIVAGYHVPKGSHILLSRVGLGRNPEVWTDPLAFKPDRHIDCETTQVVLTEHDLRFISFSTGRRGCIGTVLGTTMTVMLLARLIQGFDWSKPPNVSSINLAEAKNELFLDQPLVACAKPRLSMHLYP